MITEKAKCYISDPEEEGKLDLLLNLNGDNVHKTYLDFSGAFGMSKRQQKKKGEETSKTETTRSHLLKVISKGTTLQIWDINKQTAKDKAALW